MFLTCRRNNSVRLAAVLTGLLYAAAGFAFSGFFLNSSKSSVPNTRTVMTLRLSENNPAIKQNSKQSEEKKSSQTENPPLSADFRPAAKKTEQQSSSQTAADFAADFERQNENTDKNNAENAQLLQTSMQSAETAETFGDHENAKKTFLSELDQKIRQNLVYPERARKRNAEGTITADIGITKEGRLFYCRLSESSGSTLLDEAALALLTGIFPLSVQPPYAFETSIRITYHLE